MHVFDEEDLDKAKSYFDKTGIASKFIEVPFQGRTLRFSDNMRTVVDLVATMDQQPRNHVAVHTHKGARALRLVVPFVVAAATVSCSAKDLPPPGEVMIVVSTDASPPKDIDTLHIQHVTKGAGAMIVPAFLFFLIDEKQEKMIQHRYMVIGYIAVWTIYIGYLLFLFAKLQRLRREADALGLANS